LLDRGCKTRMIKVGRGRLMHNCLAVDPWRNHDRWDTHSQTRKVETVGRTLVIGWRNAVLRWRNVVVDSSMLIIGDDEKRRIPKRRVADGVVDVSNQIFAVGHIVWRMFVGGVVSKEVKPPRFEKRHCWKIASCTIVMEFRHEVVVAYVDGRAKIVEEKN